MGGRSVVRDISPENVFPVDFRRIEWFREGARASPRSAMFLGATKRGSTAIADILTDALHERTSTDTHVVRCTAYPLNTVSFRTQLYLCWMHSISTELLLIHVAKKKLDLF